MVYNKVGSWTLGWSLPIYNFVEHFLHPPSKEGLGGGGARVSASHVVTKSSTKGDVTGDDSQRRFLAQYSVATLE